MFRTNFKTNVVMHAQDHVRSFLQHLYPGNQNKEKRKSTLTHMFKDSTISPDKLMLKSVKRVLQRTNFHSLDYTWYAMIPALWRLQRFNEANNLPNFKIIPQGEHGRKAIHICTQTMNGLLNSLRPRGKKLQSNEYEFVDTWAPYINYFKFQTGNRHFDYSITTDGTSFVALHFVRPKAKKRSDDEIRAAKEDKMNKMFQKHKQKKYKKVIGIDAGQKLLIAAEAECIGEDGVMVRKLTKYRAKSFQYDSGQLYFKKKSRIITKETLDTKERNRALFELAPPPADNSGFNLTEELRDVQLMERRKNHRDKVKNALLRRKVAGTLTPHQKRTLHRQEQFGKVNYRNRMELSPRSWNFEAYVRFELDNLVNTQNVLINPLLAHYKFKRRIFVTKTVVNIAQQLVETGKIVPNQKVKYKTVDRHKKPAKRARKGKFETAKSSTLIVLGNYKLAPNSPMKGHPRSATAQLHRELSRRCDVLVINEWNTTKGCNICKKRLEVAKPPERFCQCLCDDGKRKVWNRDINAAVNMRKLGLLELQNIPRPAAFCKGGKLKPQPFPLRRNKPEPLVHKSDSDDSGSSN